MKWINRLYYRYNKQSVFRKVLEDAARQYGISYNRIVLDSIWCRYRYGATLSNYVAFEFYRLSRWEKDQFLTDSRAIRMMDGLKKKLSDQEKRLLDDKSQTNRLFAKFIRREWLFAPEASDSEIEAFLKRHNRIIVKPVDKSQGEGIQALQTKELLADLQVFLDKAKSDRLMLEECIVQHPEMAAINPSSVNTIRLSTIRDRNGEVHIFGASLRGGMPGAVIDNLHSGGAQYSIDIEHGIVAKSGMRFDGEHNISFHPGTSHQMIGKAIPHWDIIVSTVKEAGKMLPNICYVGWDFAVTVDGCELIEANLTQGVNGMQLDGIGKYRIIRKYM